MPPSVPRRFIPYLALAAVLLLVGFNSLRSESGGSETGAPVPGPADSGARGSGRDGAGAALSISAGERRLVVDVAGGVRRPGVYRLARGSRVIDAIRRAGGLSRRARPGAINRAAGLADGQQVVVPLRAGTAATVDAGPGGGAEADPAPISLGSATTEQLEQIDGIGPVTAANIIEYRDSRGGLSSVEDIDQVSGIGPVTMEALRSSLQP